MTAQQFADREILYEQGYVINELLRVNESLWDRISNTEECDEVFEWWLVTPYLAELKKKPRGIFWDVEYAMLSTGIKYFNTCSEYWLYKVESEYIKAEKEYLAKQTDI